MRWLFVMERAISITLSLPLDLLDAVDEAARKQNTTRSKWLRDAAASRLRAETPTSATFEIGGSDADR
jgi:metal-responsive CopG/Arc/MetJ family transcriptional regulator